MNNQQFSPLAPVHETLINQFVLQQMVIITALTLTNSFTGRLSSFASASSMIWTGTDSRELTINNIHKCEQVSYNIDSSTLPKWHGLEALNAHIGFLKLSAVSSLQPPVSVQTMPICMLDKNKVKLQATF